jgi:nitrogen fixation/metabolism regulation signal transduction histidine kinase
VDPVHLPTVQEGKGRIFLQAMGRCNDMNGWVADMETKSKKNILPVAITGFFLALSLASTYIINQATEPSPLISTNILMLTLINVNITLVVVLLLLLSRNLIKVFLEEKRLGFKRKLIFSFIGLSLIPSILLFFVASGLLTSSIESGLSIEVERSLDASLNVAQDYYDQARQTTERFAKQIRKELIEQNSLKQHPDRLKMFMQKAQKRYDVDAIHILTPDNKMIQSTWPDLKWAVGETFHLSSDFSGKTTPIPLTTVMTREQGALVRVVLALPTVSTLVVDRMLSIPIVEKIEMIKRETDEYKQLKSFRRPIKKSYILSFSVVVLLIIFSATWFGFYLARGITIPIEKLAEGTAAVAQGNLNFHIDLAAKDELGALVTSFNKMTHDLKQSREALVRAEKIATWQEVALQMAHEIKNPLTPIQLSTERLRRKYFEHSPEFDTIFDESTQTVINEVEGLVTLVNAFSNFARLPAVNLVSQEIKPILLEVVQLYKLWHKEIQFHLQFDETMPPLRIDREQIKRVLINLIENAVEAATFGEAPTLHRENDSRTSVAVERQGPLPPSGTIFLSTSFDRIMRQARIEVGDDGVGIAPEDVGQIFLPHFTRKKRGSGLGLAIVHRIVIDHGGHISVMPRKPNGTIFTVLLPA